MDARRPPNIAAIHITSRNMAAMITSTCHDHNDLALLGVELLLHDELALQHLVELGKPLRRVQYRGTLQHHGSALQHHGHSLGGGHRSHRRLTVVND